AVAVLDSSCQNLGSGYNDAGACAHVPGDYGSQATGDAGGLVRTASVGPAGFNEGPRSRRAGVKASDANRSLRPVRILAGLLLVAGAAALVPATELREPTAGLGVVCTRRDLRPHGTGAGRSRRGAIGRRVSCRFGRIVSRR